MRALYFDGGLTVRDDLPVPKPQPGEALVRVRLAGICNTDLEITRGYMNFAGVPGHEFVGELVEPAGVLPAGTRVVGEINAGCGRCQDCEAGDPRHCWGRTVLGIQGHNGSHAEYLALPRRNLHPVPDDVPDELAVLTEPLAAAYEVVEQRPPREHEAWLVLGDGKLGLLVAAVLAVEDAQPLLAGHHGSKLRIAEGWNIGTIRAEDLAVGDRSWDVVVDCTGSPDGLRDALKLVRPRGTVVLKTTVAGPTALNPAPIVINEIALIGSRCGPFARALIGFAKVRARGIQLEQLIQRTWPLDDVLQAYDAAGRAGAMKHLLRP
jgi:threonine dehydrogenase-like Zn-dependent dehydrogenase